MPSTSGKLAVAMTNKDNHYKVKKSPTTLTTQINPASAGSGGTGIAKALTLIEPGAAGRFLWLLSFPEKESDYHQRT
jgi:hypothetical protein